MVSLLGHLIIKFLQVRDTTSKAVNICKRVSTPSEKCAVTLKKMFRCSTASLKRKFDPNDECVASGEKRKKKSTSMTLNGDAVFELAGQGSLYLLLEEPSEV